MKLLLPLFASLMLQCQVKSEFFVIKRCLMGFGKCKDSCLTEEMEIQTCKSKKCCVGSRVTKLIKSYLRHEIPRLPDDDIIEMLRSEKNSREEMRRKQALVTLSQIRAANHLPPSINSALVPNASPVKSVTTKIGRSCPSHAASAKRHTKQSKDSTKASLQPPAGPP
ncbi:beta-defensin 129 [Acomys russatus]|uniref:beta-defensin 129 n=1 Tax=Acomys russatus TaxID=60746 RepID=UPI0021E296A6|nr:beta-defensin 129 [Acomys russatus]